MRKLLLITLACQLLVGVAFAREYSDKEFTTIFNGKNLDGWYLKIKSGDEELAKKIFAVEKGQIHVYNDKFPEEYELEAGTNNTHGLMYTNKKYSKFIFRFEYKWGTKISNNFSKFQYDAGFYYHVTNDKIWPIGIEYQVRYNHVTKENHTGDYYIPKSPRAYEWWAKGGRYLSEKDGGILLSAERGGLRRAAANAEFHALDGEWNKCEIIVMADQYSIHKLNGKVVNVMKNFGIKEGVVGLQCETAEIFYRNICVLEFDEIIPIEEFLN